MSTATDIEYLTIEQAADPLEIDDLTLKQWIARGTLPVHEFADSQARIKRSDVDRINVPLPLSPASTIS